MCLRLKVVSFDYSIFANSEDLWLTSLFLSATRELDPVALGLSCPLVNRPRQYYLGLETESHDCDLQVDLLAQFTSCHVMKRVFKQENDMALAKVSIPRWLIPITQKRVEVFWSLLRRTWPLLLGSNMNLEHL